MTVRRLLVLFNPCAGNGLVAARLAGLADRVPALADAVMGRIRSLDDAREAVTRAQGRVTTVVAAGGDGTVALAATALLLQAGDPYDTAPRLEPRIGTARAGATDSPTATPRRWLRAPRSGHTPPMAWEALQHYAWVRFRPRHEDDHLKSPRAIIAAASIVVLAACESSPKAVVAPPVCALAPSLAIAPALVPQASHYDSIFAAVGAELGVPAELLRAIGYLETRWQMVEGHEEFPGMPAAYGVMALRGERLSEGARLARHTEADVRTHPAANIRAGAALLRAYADSLGISGDDPDHWAPAVARFSGIELPAGRESYVRELSALREGRRSNPAPPALSQSAADACAPPPASPADQAGVVWRPSPNYNQRMSGVGGQAYIVIIHSCEGSYIGCWSWLANSSSQVSAHYVVREDGAEITQLVQEASRAWHIAAIYDSTLNSGHAGHLHGIQSNHFTIGVEHAGYASQTSWSAAQIEASARLVCDVARRWQIPRDRLHFVAHGQLQPFNRTDPGAWWPWDDFLARIERHCS